MTSFPPIVEAQIDGTWVDITDRVRDVAPIVIDRGRDDEASRTQPSKTTLVLKNQDGAFTPGNAVSPYYPHVGRKMPVRVRMPGGTPHLADAGGANNYASTPDHADLDISFNLWAAAEATVPNLHSFGGPVVAYDLVYKWGAPGVRSYYLFVGGGRIWFYWSDNGTTEYLVSRPYIPITADGRMAYGVHFRGNDGAGGHAVQFYVAERLEGPWTAAGDPTSAFSGTTSIHAGTAPLLVGRHEGRTYKAEVRSGSMFGAIVANPDFTSRPNGTASFADTAGTPKIWSFNGTARVDDHSTRFYGAADAVELTWPQPAHRGSNDPQVARATIPASVALRRLLQGTSALHSTLRRRCTAPSVAASVQAYWPMEDGREATHAASPIPGVQPMVIGGGLEFASDDSLTASGPLPSIPAGEPFGWNGAVPPPPAGTTQQRFDMFFYIETPDVSPSDTLIYHIGTTGSVRQWRARINDTTILLSARDNDFGLIAGGSFPSDPRFFNTWVLLSLNLVQNGANIDWRVDLVPIPLGLAFGTSGTINNHTFGRISAVANLENNTPPDGLSVGHFVVTTGQPLGWLAGSDTAWAGETAAHRFHRLCREERVPYSIIGDPTVLSHFRGDPALSKLMGPQRQLPLLDLLQECVDADGGRLMERRDAPGLVLRLAHTLYNQDTAVTFDVAQQQMAPSFRATQDDQLYRNDITATRPEGSFAHATTDPPPAPTETYDDNVEVNVAADPQLLDQAQWRVHLFSRDDLRHPDWNSNLGRAGTAVTRAWTEVVEGDRLVAEGLMDQHPESVAVLAEGWREVLDFFTWKIGINGSPADRWEVGVRDDDVRGRRDTAGSELASAINETATSLGITVTQGPGWTQEASDFPFDLDVGGEQITAGGWVDFGGIYVFTSCTRSVNGVEKAHAAGTPVRLWRPSVRAL